MASSTRSWSRTRRSSDGCPSSSTERAWREWQSVWGGAELSCDLAGGRLHARVAQPYGRQEYSFALSVDGVVQPGSDDLPPPRAVKRHTVMALAALALVVAAVTVMTQLYR